MKVLVTGANGQLGRSLQAIAHKHPDLEFDFVSHEEFDVSSYISWSHRFFDLEYKTDWIVNCAAYTNVDKAEKEREKCEKVNVVAAEYLRDFSHKFGFKVMQLSTDYVYDGYQGWPYAELDTRHPLCWYGMTKAMSEDRIKWIWKSVLLRTSWVYSEYGHNFVKTMLRLGAEKEEIRVVNDQVGSPTYAGYLAEVIMMLLERDLRGELKYGYYHYSNEGVCSWYDFAHSIMRMAGLPAKVIPIPGKDYPCDALRPSYSVLNKEKIKGALNLEIPHWEDSLRKCLANMNVVKEKE